MFNLDLGLFNLREFPLVTEVFSSKRLFEGIPSNPLSILNVSIRSPRCLLSSRVVRFKLGVRDITGISQFRSPEIRIAICF